MLARRQLSLALRLRRWPVHPNATDKEGARRHLAPSLSISDKGKAETGKAGLYRNIADRLSFHRPFFDALCHNAYNAQASHRQMAWTAMIGSTPMPMLPCHSGVIFHPQGVGSVVLPLLYVRRFTHGKALAQIL